MQSEKNCSISKLNSSNAKYSDALSFSNEASRISDQESTNLSCSSAKISSKVEESSIFSLDIQRLKSEGDANKSQLSAFRTRRFTVPQLRIQYQNSVSIDEEKFDANNTSVTPIDIENIQFIDYIQNFEELSPSQLRNVSDLMKNNDSSSDVDIRKNFDSQRYQNQTFNSRNLILQNSKSDSNFLSKNEETLMEYNKNEENNVDHHKNLKNNEQENLETLDKYNLRVSKKFLHSQEYSSENLLSPHVQKYEDISEDYASSRSDSPSERRSERKASVFRRESRFRSIRELETEKLSTKDKKLLKMILVIFASFLVCYLPITITKTFKDVIDWRGLNIVGYILIYLTTCINPVIYVIMSSEYRSAYKNVLLCRNETSSQSVKIIVFPEKKKKSHSRNK